MKKYLLVVTMLFSIFITKAQSQNDSIKNPHEKNNEAKINVLFPLFGTVEGSYERILNKKSSLGISLLAVFNNKKSNQDVNYMISPYYRRYFGKNYASGFFAEGFSMLSSIDGKRTADINGNLTVKDGSEVIDLSLGIGLGHKWVTKSGFIFEVNAGLGKLLFNADKTDHTQVARFGFHIGKRF